jgi:hypothetical protein
MTEDGDLLGSKPKTLIVDEGGTLVVTAGSATLAGVEDLTVNGTVNARGTAVVFAGLTGNSARGSGTLILGNKDFGPYANMILGVENVESAAATITTTTSATEGFVIPANNTLTLTGTVATTEAVTVSGKLVIKGSMTPAASVTVKDYGAIEVTRADPDISTPGRITYGAGGKLTITKGLKLSIAEFGRVTLSDLGSLVLGGDDDDSTRGPGAILDGSGRLVVGATEIVGGTYGWKVITGSAGTATTIVTIAALNTSSGAASTKFPYMATITANAGATTKPIFTALGVGATITQQARPDNQLIVGANTVIALGAPLVNAVATDAGSLVLLGDKDHPGEIVFAAIGSAKVTANNSAPRNTVSYAAAAKIDGVTFQENTVASGVLEVGTDGTGNGGNAAGQFTQLSVTGAINKSMKGGSDDKSPITLKATADVK